MSEHVFYEEQSVHVFYEVKRVNEREREQEFRSLCNGALKHRERAKKPHTQPTCSETTAL